MKKGVFALITTVALLSSVDNLHAKEAGSGPNPYVDCGIGAALFPDTHWAAVSSNVIWDVGTTAVTSATASPETCQGKEVEVAEFINRTYNNLIEDTAKGEGQYLTAMLDIYGCKSSAKHQMITDLRKSVAKGLSSESYVTQTQIQKSEFFYNQINKIVAQQDVNTCAA